MPLPCTRIQNSHQNFLDNQAKILLHGFTGRGERGYCRGIILSQRVVGYRLTVLRQLTDRCKLSSELTTELRVPSEPPYFAVVNVGRRGKRKPPRRCIAEADRFPTRLKCSACLARRRDLADAGTYLIKLLTNVTLLVAF